MNQRMLGYRLYKKYIRGFDPEICCETNSLSLRRREGEVLSRKGNLDLLNNFPFSNFHFPLKNSSRHFEENNHLAPKNLLQNNFLALEVWARERCQSRRGNPELLTKYTLSLRRREEEVPSRKGNSDFLNNSQLKEGRCVW